MIVQRSAISTTDTHDQAAKSYNGAAGVDAETSNCKTSYRPDLICSSRVFHVGARVLDASPSGVLGQSDGRVPKVTSAPLQLASPSIWFWDAGQATGF